MAAIPHRKFVLASATERAWAAGYFDGEGSTCFAILPYKSKLGVVDRPVINLSVSQLEDGKAISERFLAAVGGLGTVFSYKRSNGRRDIWRWCATSLGEIQTVAGVLWPFLSTPKREQFARALNSFTKTYRERVILPMGMAMVNARKALKA